MRPTDSASIAAHYEAQFGRLPDADPDRAFRSQQRMGARSSSWAQLHRLPMRWASGHAGRFDSARRARSMASRGRRGSTERGTPETSIQAQQH